MHEEGVQRGPTLIEVIIVVVIVLLLASVAIPGVINRMNRHKETTTKANTHTVQLAVEEFASLNGGEYPEDVDQDRTKEGNHTLIELLPDGQYMRNAFHDHLLEPSNGNFKGSINYRKVDSYGVKNRYIIEAAGRQAGTFIITLTNVEHP